MHPSGGPTRHCTTWPASPGTASTHMHRHAQRASEKQIPLRLGPGANPADESALREAFDRTSYVASHMSLERALQHPLIAIGLKNCAEAITEKGGH